MKFNDFGGVFSVARKNENFTKGLLPSTKIMVIVVITDVFYAPADVTIVCDDDSLTEARAQGPSFVIDVSK